MSTVKAVNFQHPSSTAANLTLAADGTVTGGLPAGGRNLLYNGAMQVAQRSISTASITAAGYYTADRWITSISSLGTWTASVENDAPTGSGLRRSSKVLCSTAAASPSASGQASFIQRLEGQDVQRIAKGTTSAQQLTLSFWVKSNVTGTYVAYLYDNDNNRICSQSYTVSSNATWEKKSITFPADMTGALDNDNADSFSVAFQLAAGSNFTSGTLQTTWASYTAANQAVGQVNLASAINNYWQITGVQLETGSVATPFEFKSYGQELRECQRYFNRLSATGTGVTYSGGGTTKYSLNFPVMRITPVITQYSACAVEDGTSAYAATWSSYGSATQTSSWIVVTSTSFGASGKAIIVRDHVLDLNAEL